MDNETLLISTQKKLKNNFFLWFSALLILGILCFASDHPFPKLNPNLTINFQQLLILCMLGGIPGTLVWSRKKMKALIEVIDIEKRLVQYVRYVHIRQTIFFVLGFFTLFMHVFTTMHGSLMLFMVVICLSVFIIPTKGRLLTEAHIIIP